MSLQSETRSSDRFSLARRSRLAVSSSPRVGRSLSFDVVLVMSRSTIQCGRRAQLNVRFPPKADTRMTEVGRPPSITSMRHVWERIAAVALTTFAVSGCTFGMLETNECLRLYRPGLMDAASQARSRGSISQESFGYCVDGKRRAEAMLAPLREHGFTVNGPSKAFRGSRWLVLVSVAAGLR